MMLLKSIFILGCIIMYTDCLYMSERDSWPPNVQAAWEGPDFAPAGFTRQNRMDYQSAGAQQETVIVAPNQGYPVTRSSYGYGAPAMNRDQTVIVSRHMPDPNYNQAIDPYRTY